MHSKLWDEITYPFPRINGCTGEVWEWISNPILHFVIDVLAYACWDWNWSTLVKGAIVGNDHKLRYFILFTHTKPLFCKDSLMQRQIAFYESQTTRLELKKSYPIKKMT